MTLLEYLYLNLWGRERMQRFIARARKVCFISLVFGLLLLGVQCKPMQAFPEEGFWHCEDLQMQICFNHVQSKYDTYIILEDLKIDCALFADYGNRFFSINYHDTVIAEYNYDTRFFEGEFISFDKDTLIIKDINNQEQYVFSRIDTP